MKAKIKNIAGITLCVIALFMFCGEPAEEAGMIVFVVYYFIALAAGYTGLHLTNTTKR